MTLGPVSGSKWRPRLSLHQSLCRTSKRFAVKVRTGFGGAMYLSAKRKRTASSNLLRLEQLQKPLLKPRIVDHEQCP